MAVNHEYLDYNSYVRLLEIVVIALELASGQEVEQADHPRLGISRKEGNTRELVPAPEPFSFDQLRRIYDGQRKALATAT